MKRNFPFKVQTFPLFLLLIMIAAAFQAKAQLTSKPANTDFDKASDFFKTGIKFLKEGKTDAAVERFAAAVKLKPDYAEARNALGTALFNLQRNGEAIESLREAVKLKPDYANAY